MKAPRRARVLALAGALVLTAAFPLAQSADKVDYDAVFKIKEEGLQRSKVMDITATLTDVYGGRLTNSPSHRAAAEYVKTLMTEWGLANVKSEPFSFGQGWSNERTVVHAIAPTKWPIIAYPKAWTPGTNGPVTAEAVFATIETAADFDKYKGKLGGKIVFTAPPREVQAQWQPLATRFTDKELDEMESQPVGPVARRAFNMGDPEVARRRTEFLKAEGVVMLVEPSRLGQGGTVFVSSGGPRDPKQPAALPQLVMAVEHYNRIVRLLAKNVPVSLELDVRNHFYLDDLNAFNIVGEIPGSDPKLAPEVVMIGGHFDGWHAGTGATDNAAGSAVMLEALRILKASGLKMRRTVRIGLWGGEEQGLLGSRAYATEHFADRSTMALKPEHEKLSGYFNVDNGTGAIRGVYLQGNEAVAPIFAAWMEPFHNIGMSTLTIRNTGGTDHLAFDAVGIPGFQFIQDEIEYDTVTHHSNMDVLERVQPGDMMKNAVIVASFVYHTANRDQRLPRKPLPKPQAPGQGRPF